MNKKTFLGELKKHLVGLPKEELDDIIADYTEHFDAGKKHRRKEETIAKSLGNPKDLAKQLKAQYAIKRAKKTKKPAHVFKAVLATIGLSFFNLVFIIGPFFAFISVLISFFASAVAIILSGIAVLIAAFVAPVIFSLGVSGIFFLGVAFAGIGLIALGVLFAIGSYYVTKYFGKLMLTYLNYNIDIVKGGK